MERARGREGGAGKEWWLPGPVIRKFQGKLF